MKITEQDKSYPKIKAFQFESTHLYHPETLPDWVQACEYLYIHNSSTIARGIFLGCGRWKVSIGDWILDSPNRSMEMMSNEQFVLRYEIVGAYDSQTGVFCRKHRRKVKGLRITNNCFVGGHTEQNELLSTYRVTINPRERSGLLRCGDNHQFFYLGDWIVEIDNYCPHTKSYPMGLPHVVKAEQFADFYQIVDEQSDE